MRSLIFFCQRLQGDLSNQMQRLNKIKKRLRSLFSRIFALIYQINSGKIKAIFPMSDNIY